MHIYLYTYIQGSDSSHFVVNFLKKSLVFKWLSPQITRIFPSSRSSCASGTCRALLLAGTWELFCGDLLTETKEPSRGSKFAMCLWVCVWVCECVWVCTRLRVHPSTLAKLFFSPSFFFPCIFFLSVFLAPIFLLPLCAHVLTQQSALPPFPLLFLAIPHLPLSLVGSSSFPSSSLWLFPLFLFIFSDLLPLPRRALSPCLLPAAPELQRALFAATHCNTLHPTAEGSFCGYEKFLWDRTSGVHFIQILRRNLVLVEQADTLRPRWCFIPSLTATHCNTLQHTATHFILSLTATHCNTLQHTATHCNTLQHTWFHRWLHTMHRHSVPVCDAYVWCICVMHMRDA